MNNNFFALNRTKLILITIFCFASIALNYVLKSPAVYNAVFTVTSLAGFCYLTGRTREPSTGPKENKAAQLSPTDQGKLDTRQIDEIRKQLLAASTTLTDGTAKINEAVEKTSNAAMLIISNVGQITIFGSSAKTAAEEADGKSKAGKDVMDQLAAAMKGIEQTEAHLTEIVSGMDSITLKAKFINDIVFQSKLLSFNASIEAARAGEHGKGFAVVALEVGKLAETSGRAASEINELLDVNRSHAGALVETVTSRTRESKGVLEAALKSFGGITADVTLIREQLNSVYQAAQEQKKGAEETLSAVQRFSEITQASDEVKKMILSTIDRLNDLAKSGTA